MAGQPAQLEADRNYLIGNVLRRLLEDPARWRSGCAQSPELPAPALTA